MTRGWGLQIELTDLEDVIFLANANRLDTIPAALRDRLEIIEVSGYSEEEKSEITRQYIIPKVIGQNGLKLGKHSFTLKLSLL